MVVKKIFVFEMMRTLAAFAVVFLHVGTYFYDKHILKVGSYSWWFNYLYYKSQFWAVPIFFMISGALLLQPSKTESAFDFYKKRMTRILIPILFWSLFYFIIQYYEFGLTLFDDLVLLIKGLPFYHLWFLFAMIGLYILTPFLRKMIMGLSKSEIALLIGISFFIPVVGAFVNSFFNNVETVTPFSSSFLKYVGYYLSGYYILQYKPYYNRIILFFVILLFTFFISFGGAYCIVRFNFPGSLFAGYLSPFTIIQSLAIFLFCSKYIYFEPSPKIASVITSISVCSLGIYLIHPAFIELFQQIFKITWIQVNIFVSVPLITIIIFLFSYLISSLILQIPYINRII